MPLPQGPGFLTEIPCQGTQQPPREAIAAEVSDWIDQHQQCCDAAGRRQIVRNGLKPERTITTCVGPVTVQQPQVHDRRPPDERERFTPAILTPHLCKTKSVEELVAWLYLKA